MKKTIKNLFSTLIKVISASLLIALYLRLFFIQSFIIQSDAMNSAYSKGNAIFVNKLAYGARLPVTPLSLPFLYRNIPFTKLPCYNNAIQLPAWRLPAYQKIQRNSLLVFNLPLQTDCPIDKRARIMRRCIGLPGDSLQIIQDTVFINGKKTEFPKTVLFNYHILNYYPTSDNNLHNNFNWHCFDTVSSILGIYKTTADLQTINLFKKYNSEISLRRSKNNTLPVFPDDKVHYWDKQNYGGLLIPKKGLTISLDNKNTGIYYHVIKNFERQNTKLQNNQLFINNKVARSYTFRQNYYFVMSDNRDNYNDSRSWGFIPESHIIGKVWFQWADFN